MNTNGLVKHYDLLTPAERLALIMAAALRGDEQERARLVTSAPRKAYAVQDHAGLTHAYHALCVTHLLEVTELAALYLFVLGRVEREEDEDEGRVVEGALWLGYLVKAKQAGWRLFCAEHRFPPDFYWPRLPSLVALKFAEQCVGDWSFTPEGAREYARRAEKDPAKVPTPETIAAEMRAALQAGVDWWT